MNKRNFLIFILLMLLLVCIINHNNENQQLQLHQKAKIEEQEMQHRQLENQIVKLEEENKKAEKNFYLLSKKYSSILEEKNSFPSGKQFEITAYDASVESNSYGPEHPYYGLTADGYNFLNKTREEAMTIAVDPDIIPLGSKVLITFKNNEYQKYNGVYTARDTGGAIKGHIIDLYMGDFGLIYEEHNGVDNFGRQKATVFILE